MSQTEVSNTKNNNTNPISGINNHSSVIAAIKGKFVSTVSKIYINSLEREIAFREITVAEQKKLARIMIDNEKRKDVIYDAQCAILQSICLDKDIKIVNLSEFDKIKLLIILYQRNMIKQDIVFTCPECGSENKYKLDFNKIIDKLDSFDLNEKQYTYENQQWEFKFKLNYPKVSHVSDFYSHKYLEYKRSHDKKILQSLNSQINIDYINLYITEISFKDKINDQEFTTINLNDFSFVEIADILSVFPQDVFYSEKGIIQYITTEFITAINDCFEKHTCAVCGYVNNRSLDDSIDDFL